MVVDVTQSAGQLEVNIMQNNVFEHFEATGSFYIDS